LLKWMKTVFNEYTHTFWFSVVLLFAVLPIHTEVIASIKNRDILLSFLFSLLGSLYFFKAINENKYKALNVLLSILFFYLGLLSKLDIIPFLAIVPVIALLQFKIKVKWLFGFIIAFLISFFIFKVTRHFGLDSVRPVRTFLYFENPLYFEHNYTYRFLSMFNCFGFYILQCIFPLKQSSYYGVDTIPTMEFSFFYGTLGVLFIGFVIYGLIWSLRKKENAMFIGLFIFCAAISMYLNLLAPVVGIVADRFSFSASLGFVIFILAAYQKWSNPKLIFSATAKAFIGMVLVFFSVLIIQRNSEWKDLNTLCEADVKKYPESVFLNYKAGANILKSMEARNNSQLKNENQKQVADARAHFEKALSVCPDYTEVLNQLSYVLVFMYNDFANALPYINKSLSLEESTEVLYYKGICYRELHKQDSSEIILLNCIEKDITYQNAYDLLVYDYNAQKKYNKSITLLQKAIDNGYENEKIKTMLSNAKLFAGEK
jgi:tetratricopeptide (TPR) repeat protein